MGSRYQNRSIESTPKDDEIYGELIRNRGLNKIIHHTTAKFRFPTQDEMTRFETIDYEWKLGDKYFKLAYQFYGDPTYWWIIAKFNSKPTEIDVKIGDVITIPYPLSSILKYLRG